MAGSPIFSFVHLTQEPHVCELVSSAPHGLFCIMKHLHASFIAEIPPLYVLYRFFLLRLPGQGLSPQLCWSCPHGGFLHCLTFSSDSLHGPKLYGNTLKSRWLLLPKLNLPLVQGKENLAIAFTKQCHF
jgi:hypothetical protein